MPHVVSQMLPRERSEKMYNHRQKSIKTTISQDNFRSPSGQRRQNANGVAPTLSLLVTPQSAWKYTSGRQLKHFSPERSTPVSAVDSVFELPSATTNISPNSAISTFIAELEDTSPGAVKPQYPNMDSKSPISPALSLHAATAIDAINDFEAENKRLLERAVAAENAAKRLEEQNMDLRRQVKYCMEQHRPKTAPSQVTSQDPRKRGTEYSTMTPLSAFNTMMDYVEADYLPTPINTPTLFPRRNSSLPTQSPVLQQSKITPNRLGPNGFISSRRPPPIPEGTKVPFCRIQSRHPDMVRKNDVNNLRTTSSNSRITRISLADAKLREKPLPPLGPMAPSAIPSVSEIGTTHEDLIPRQQLWTKKSFAKFFRKGTKE